MQDWFYRKGDQVVGPVSRQELDFLATEGRVSASTLVRPGNRGDWRRYRLATQSSAKSTAAPIRQKPLVREDVPRAIEPSVPQGGPPELTVQRDWTKREITIGVALALLVIFLLWFFWTQFSGSSLRRTQSTPRGGVAQQETSQADGLGDADSQDKEQPATGEANVASSTATDAGDPEFQHGEPLDNSGDSDVETDSAGQTAQDVAQSTASADPAHDKKQDDDLATETLDGRDSIRAGDPMSRFTVTASGEAVFFGLRATGNRFAFVVDRSGSMDGVRMQRAREELMNCIQSMPAHVEVFVVFFNDVAHPDAGQYRKVTARNINELSKWVEDINAVGGTQVTEGMKEVFAKSRPPDAIFLLTDGDFDNGTPQVVKQLNSSGSVRINTVALVSQSGERLLKQIAKENSGDYRYVP